MARDPIPSWFFVLVVVRRDDQFLVVHERKHGGGFYLPAGRVEIGETFEAAARRETREEAGIEIVFDGILRVEHAPHPSRARLRIIYLARPAPGSQPRTEPNEHSMGAAFHSIDALRAMPLRGQEVIDLFEAVQAGAPAHPMDLIVWEGASWRQPAH